MISALSHSLVPRRSTATETLGRDLVCLASAALVSALVTSAPPRPAGSVVTRPAVPVESLPLRSAHVPTLVCARVEPVEHGAAADPLARAERSRTYLRPEPERRRGIVWWSSRSVVDSL